MAMTGGTAERVLDVKGNYGNGSSIKLYVYYKSTQDVAKNQSTVYVGMYVTTPSGYEIGPWTDKGGSYVGTTSNTFSGSFSKFSGTKWLVENQTFTVNHNSDGTATATIYWKWGVNSPWGQCVYPSSSFDITLPNIARAATITSVSNANLGSSTNVVFTPTSASFYYAVKLVLGTEESWTGGRTPSNTSAYTYTTNVIPYAFGKQIASTATSGTATAYLYTFSDSACKNLVGTASTKTFTVTIPDNASTKPTVSMTLSPVNTAGKPWSSLYVQGLSKVQATLSGSGQYGATIANSKLVVGGVGYASPYLSNVIYTDGSISVTGQATDSRGRTGSTTQTITMIPYGKPRIVPCTGDINIVCERCKSDEDDTFDELGKHLHIKAMLSYSKIMSRSQQHNYCRMDYRFKKGDGGYYDWMPLIERTDTNEQVDVILGDVCTDTTSSYTVQLRALDDVGNTEVSTYTISSAKVDFNLKDGGGGAAFGKYAETPNAVEVADDWELIVRGNRWKSLGLSENDYVDVPNTTVGTYGRVPAGECCYRVENGNHVYVAFNCSFNYGTMRTYQINKDAIPEKYRPQNTVSTFCTCQGMYVVRVFVMQSGNVVIEYVQSLTSNEITTNVNLAWVDGYIDYFITA